MTRTTKVRINDLKKNDHVQVHTRMGTLDGYFVGGTGYENDGDSWLRLSEKPNDDSLPTLYLEGVIEVLRFEPDMATVVKAMEPGTTFFLVNNRTKKKNRYIRLTSTKVWEASTGILIDTGDFQGLGHTNTIEVEE